MNQRAMNLNPDPHRMEVIKITYPANHSRRRYWKIEAMRFVPHTGRAASVPDIFSPEHVNNGEPDGR